LVVGQAEAPVHPLIDLPIRRVDPALNRRLRVRERMSSNMLQKSLQPIAKPNHITEITLPNDHHSPPTPPQFPLHG